MTETEEHLFGLTPSLKSIMEQIRARSSQQRPWSEICKSLKTTLVEKRNIHLIREDRSLVKTTLEILCKRVPVSLSLECRLASIAQSLNLKLATSGNSYFISSDMFYVEITMDSSGGLSDVFVNHQGEQAFSCPELVSVLLSGDLDSFTAHLGALASMYQISGDNKTKCKAYHALSSLTKDLKILSQYIPDSVGKLYEKGGYTRLTYQVSPYREEGAMICLESSNSLNKLQTGSLIKSLPHFAALSQINSATLPACFVLKFENSNFMSMETVKNIQAVTSIDVICEETPKKKEPVIDSLVQLLEEQHSYHIIDRLSILSVKSIPFTHPTHVPQILVFLKQQSLFNGLLESCVRKLKRVIGNELTFQVTANSMSSISVDFEIEESMKSLDIDLKDNKIKCTLYPQERITEKLDDFVTKVLEKTQSIPVTMRMLLKKHKSLRDMIEKSAELSKVESKEPWVSQQSIKVPSTSQAASSSMQRQNQPPSHSSQQQPIVQSRQEQQQNTQNAMLLNMLSDMHSIPLTNDIAAQMQQMQHLYQQQQQLNEVKKTRKRKITDPAVDSKSPKRKASFDETSLPSRSQVRSLSTASSLGPTSMMNPMLGLMTDPNFMQQLLLSQQLPQELLSKYERLERIMSCPEDIPSSSRKLSRVRSTEDQGTSLMASQEKSQERRCSSAEILDQQPKNKRKRSESVDSGNPVPERSAVASTPKSVCKPVKAAPEASLISSSMVSNTATTSSSMQTPEKKLQQLPGLQPCPFSKKTPTKLGSLSAVIDKLSNKSATSSTEGKKKTLTITTPDSTNPTFKATLSGNKLTIRKKANSSQGSSLLPSGSKTGVASSAVNRPKATSTKAGILKKPGASIKFQSPSPKVSVSTSSGSSAILEEALGPRLRLDQLPRIPKAERSQSAISPSVQPPPQSQPSAHKQDKFNPLLIRRKSIQPPPHSMQGAMPPPTTSAMPDVEDTVKFQSNAISSSRESVNLPIKVLEPPTSMPLPSPSQPVSSSTSSAIAEPDNLIDVPSQSTTRSIPIEEPSPLSPSSTPSSPVESSSIVKEAVPLIIPTEAAFDAVHSNDGIMSEDEDDGLVIDVDATVSSPSKKEEPASKSSSSPSVISTSISNKDVKALVPYDDDDEDQPNQGTGDPKPDSSIIAEAEPQL